MIQKVTLSGVRRFRVQLETTTDGASRCRHVPTERIEHFDEQERPHGFPEDGLARVTEGEVSRWDDGHIREEKPGSRRRTREGALPEKDQGNDQHMRRCYRPQLAQTGPEGAARSTLAHLTPTPQARLGGAPHLSETSLFSSSVMPGVLYI